MLDKILVLFSMTALIAFLGVVIGFVAEPDPSSMAEAIRTAAATSPQQMASMGRAGRDFVRRELSWSVIGRRYREFLESAMHERTTFREQKDSGSR